MNPSLNLECVHKVPQAMTDLKGVVSDQALNAFQMICGLDQDLQTQVANLILTDMNQPGLGLA